MKKGKEEQCWNNFFEKGKYALSERERLGSKGQHKGPALHHYMDNSPIFTRLKISRF